MAEGTMTRGDNLLKLDIGAFLTDLTFQPITIRSWQTFVPKGWNT
jgi:hypothetical protein